MIEVRETHAFDCDEATFWSLYGDPDFQARLLREGLGYPASDFVEVTGEPGGRRTWRVVVTPKVELPKAIARVLRGGMVYTETATVDPAARRLTMEQVTRALGKKLALTGEITTSAQAGGGIERRVVFRIEAKVMGLKGAIERAVEENVRHSMAATAAYLRETLAAR